MCFFPIKWTELKYSLGLSQLEPDTNYKMKLTNVQDDSKRHGRDEEGFVTRGKKKTESILEQHKLASVSLA